MRFGAKALRLTKQAVLLRMAACLAALAAGYFGAVPLAAAGWPERPITIIVHFAPGGTSDLLGRLVAAELAPALKQGVIVENRPGANGNIGVAAAARAAPDGYTLLLASSSALSNPAMGKVPYDFQKDFAPVAYLGGAPLVVLAGPKTGLNTLRDLIERAKARPGSLNYGSPGHGGIGHLGGELLKLRLGIDMQHVPFTGQGPAMNAVIAGTTELAITTISGVAPLVKAGTLTAILQTGRESWPDLAGVPAVADAGIADAEIDVSQIILAPAGTPQNIIDRLEQETLAIMKRPDVKERMLKAGFAVRPMGAKDLGRQMDKELNLWRDLVVRAGLKNN